MRRLLMLGVLLASAPAVLGARVTVWPRESALGASERYTVRVPTEGTIATTSVRLEVPPDVTVTSVMWRCPGWSRTSHGKARGLPASRGSSRCRRASSPVRVPGAQSEQGTEIVWKMHQHYANGSQSDWTGPPSKSPASVTKLVAR